MKSTENWNNSSASYRFLGYPAVQTDNESEGEKSRSAISVHYSHAQLLTAFISFSRYARRTWWPFCTYELCFVRRWNPTVL